MKTYDLIKNILINKPETRNSDKLLLTEVFRQMGKIVNEHNWTERVWFGDKEAILLEDLISGDLPSYETVARARRKLQEIFPNLEATSSAVRTRRRQKQDTKGTFIFREVVK